MSTPSEPQRVENREVRRLDVFALKKSAGGGISYIDDPEGDWIKYEDFLAYKEQLEKSIMKKRAVTIQSLRDNIEALRGQIEDLENDNAHSDCLQLTDVEIQTINEGLYEMNITAEAARSQYLFKLAKKIKAHGDRRKA